MKIENHEPGKEGVSYKCTESYLKNLITAKEFNQIQLIFVSACHSEKIGEIFHQCGIPNVIAVNTQSKI